MGISSRRPCSSRATPEACRGLYREWGVKGIWGDQFTPSKSRSTQTTRVAKEVCRSGFEVGCIKMDGFGYHGRYGLIREYYIYENIYSIQIRIIYYNVVFNYII